VNLRPLLAHRVVRGTMTSRRSFKEMATATRRVTDQLGEATRIPRGRHQSSSDDSLQTAVL